TCTRRIGPRWRSSTGLAGEMPLLADSLPATSRTLRISIGRWSSVWPPRRSNTRCPAISLPPAVPRSKLPSWQPTAACCNDETAVIVLIPITIQNWETAASLDVDEHQRAFIRSNAWSIAESLYHPELVPLGIYRGGTMVGFVMYGTAEQDGQVWLFRLM